MSPRNLHTQPGNLTKLKKCARRTVKTGDTSSSVRILSKPGSVSWRIKKRAVAKFATALFVYYAELNLASRECLRLQTCPRYPLCAGRTSLLMLGFRCFGGGGVVFCRWVGGFRWLQLLVACWILPCHG